MQKTADTLGRAMRDLRISVTDRCNFRCAYCMPEEAFGTSYRFLPKNEVLTFEEIERVAAAAVGLGVKKLRLTGGEPLLRADLPELIRRLAAIEGVEDLSLTSNGHLLAGYAQALASAGLRRVTVSVDSLDEEVFKRMSGRRTALAPVLAGIAAAAAAGLTPVKINCVVKRGVNEDSLAKLVRRFAPLGHIVRFIEYMDVGTMNGWRMDDVVPAREIRALVEREFPLDPIAPNYPGEVASRFRLRGSAGEVGIVASVSRPFCFGCTRARLSPDGKLVTCLFATEGTDLRPALRRGADRAELQSILAAIWGGRADRYSEERTAHTAARRAKLEMFHLGG